MPRANFFANLGWFVAPEFFDSGTCTRIREEMAVSPLHAASILNDENELVVDIEKRHTQVAMVSDATREFVTKRMMAMMPAIEQHFIVSLVGCEPVSFLVYQPGAFFRRHTDANHRPEAPLTFRERQVSISIFLNSEGPAGELDCYSGGALAFSGARSVGEKTAYPALAIRGETGLLVGFNSSWFHEVQPILSGVRYSIVTWFA